MPNPGHDGPSDPRLVDAWEAYQRHGGAKVYGSKRLAADELGMPWGTLDSRIKRYQAFTEADPAARAAARAIGSDTIPPYFWTKTDKHGNIIHSVYSRTEKPDSDEAPEDVLDRIADRLQAIPAAPAIQRPQQTRSDVLNFVPVFDVHMAMRIGSYGTAQAVARLREASDDLLARSPPADRTIIVNGGDFTHQNDPSNLTPQSKHPLPVDAEYDDTTDTATEVTAYMIETALRYSGHVTYKALRGNHDPNSARILRAALIQRYRENPRVTIDRDGIELFVEPWEGNLICAHHGDLRRKPMEMAMGIAAKYHAEWGRAQYRELWTGHLHHLKVQEFPGITWHQVRAISPADRHSEENLYAAHSEMVSVTYRKGGGRYGVLQHLFEG